MNRVLLLSGGVDSLYLYYKLCDKTDDCIYIDYGQKFKKQELQVLKNHRIKYKIIKIDSLKDNKTEFFYGRNLKLLLAIADRYKGTTHVQVIIGCNKDDEFSDNNEGFMCRAESIISDSYGMIFMIITPLSNMRKKEIATKLRNLTDRTPYWCHKGTKNPCGECHGCKAMIKAGVFDLWKQK